MPWTNYHSHTFYCDGSDSPERYVSEAIQQGMPAYGYSSHAPVPFKTDWCIPDSKISSYVRDIKSIKEKYSDKIEVYLGLEVDYVPGIAGKNKHLVKNLELDYFIGSIHYVDSFKDGVHWNIDHSRGMFDKGLKEIFSGDFRQASGRFYELTKQMALTDKPDIIGHLDKIKMYNSGNKYFSEKENWYRKQIEETLGVIKMAGSIVEVNTRGYYKYNQLDLYPSQWIIEKMAEMDIPVMLNSDAHSYKELLAGFEYAAEMLEKAGIKRLWTLLNGEWCGLEYSKHGLVL